MAENDIAKIIIRHTSGSRANSVQEFSLDGRRELRFGRDPSCDVTFDPVRDDVVSRVHAVIRVDPEAKSGFSVEDLGSRNGTFLNKKKVEGKTEILPDDILSLGLNGPSLIFDLSPRPAHLVARTKLVEIAPAAATRVVGAAESSTAFGTAVDGRAASGGTTQTTAAQPGGKETIGRKTMLHELDKVRSESLSERKAAGQKWFLALAGVIALAAAGGGFLVWKQSRDAKSQEAALRQARMEVVRVERESASQSKETIEEIHKQLGMTPLDIVSQYGPATAKIEVRWRLFDEASGRDVYHKKQKYKDGKYYKLFVRYSDGPVAPILVLDDENRTNPVIGGIIEGSAFGVSDQGFLLTNRHLATAWKSTYFDNDEDVILIDCYQKKKNAKCAKVLAKTSDDIFRDVRKWIPESGWYLYDADDLSLVGGNTPDNSSTRQHSFYGKNESIKATFANTKLAMSAAMVRVSDENDIALLKVDSPEKINIVKIATNSTPAAGEKITVIGYPAFALETYAVSEKYSDKQLKTTESFVPQPYVTEGIVAVVSNRILAKDGVTMYGIRGDMMQLTINSTGAGNSGGPVFNSFGEVIGIFSTSYAYKSGFGSSSGAVPIKYGLELMR